jgi:hypothetical protein
VRQLAIEEIEEKTNQIKNKESVLTKQNKEMDDLEKDFQNITVYLLVCVAGLLHVI